MGQAHFKQAAPTFGSEYGSEYNRTHNIQTYDTYRGNNI